MGFVSCSSDDKGDFTQAVCYYQNLGFASFGDYDRYIWMRDQSLLVLKAIDELDKEDPMYQAKYDDHMDWYNKLQKRMDALVIER